MCSANFCFILAIYRLFCFILHFTLFYNSHVFFVDERGASNEPIIIAVMMMVEYIIRYGIGASFIIL